MTGSRRGAESAAGRHAAGKARRIRTAWALLAGNGSAAIASLGVLVFCSVFIAVAGPRASLGLQTRAFQQALAAVPSAERSVLGTIDYGTYEQALGSPFPAAQLSLSRLELARHLASGRLPLAGGAAAWSGLTSGYAQVSGAGPRVQHGCQPAQMELLYRERLGRYARLVSGAWPASGVSGHGTQALQVAVTPATASVFGLRPGSRLGMGALELAVTGIIAPRQPRSAFWGVDPDAAGPTLNSCGGSPGSTYWVGAAFTGAAQMPFLQTRLDNTHTTLTWDFPLATGHLTASQAPALEDELNTGVARAAQLVTSTNGQATTVALGSGLVSTVAAFIAEDHSIAGVLDLLFVSLAVIGAVVVLLAARLVAEHRNGEFAVMRARGASLRQLGWLAVRSAVVVTLPAAAAAAALAAGLTPRDGGPLPVWLTGAVLVTALAGLPLTVMASQRGGSRRLDRQRSRRAAARQAAARRVVAELTAACAAAGGLIVLRAQGGTTSGADIYAQAAPVLVAIPAAIVVLRLYPLAVRVLLRSTGKRRGVTAYLGLARAAGGRESALLPTFALILGLAVVAFGAMVHDAITRGEQAASWQQTGADAIVDASGANTPLSPGIQRRIAAVPGAVRTAAVAATTGSPENSAALAVAVVNPARYAALIAATPAPRFPARALARPPAAGASPPAVVPVLATPVAAAQLGKGSTSLQVGSRALTIRVAGRVAGIPGVPGNAAVVLPAWAFGASPPSPTLMLVAGSHVDAAKLASLVQHALPGAMLTLRSSVLAQLAGAPLPRGGSLTLAAGAAAAAGLSMVILLISLILSARSRELTLGRLSAMGLSAAQARWLVVVEAMPQVLAAIAGGIVSAWALAVLLGPSISLAGFTGSAASVPVHAEPGPLAAAAGALLLLAFIVVAAQTVIAGRRGAARALRME